MNDKAYRIRVAVWDDDKEALQLIREQVFVEEQNVPQELEWDGLDEKCLHLLAEDSQGNPIGTGRLLPDGHIGRMAVLAEWRGKHVGTALLHGLMQEAQQRGYKELLLASQLHAMPFYEKSGFVAEGDVFDDAGIPHRTMRWQVN